MLGSILRYFWTPRKELEPMTVDAERLAQYFPEFEESNENEESVHESPEDNRGDVS